MFDLVKRTVIAVLHYIGWQQYQLSTLKNVILIEQSHTATEMINVHNNFWGCHMPDIFKEILQCKLFSSASMIYTIFISCGYQCSIFQD